MNRNAFTDPISGVLKCHGFVESNQPGDIKTPVDEDFNLKPGDWKLENGNWVPVPAPVPE